MMNISNLILTTSPLSQPARKPRETACFTRRQRPLCGKKCRHSIEKERDAETGLLYYGARYLDGRAGRWISGDPAVGGYVPEAPVDGGARKRNGSLPGQGGVFNHVNLHVYHYAGNNPVKYVDPDGEAINFAAGALIGAVTSGVVNVAGQYVAAKISGQEFKLDAVQLGAAVLGGAVAGAITSGASAIASLTYQPLGQTVMAVGGAAAGAAGSTVSTVTENAMKGNELTMGLKENVIKCY